MNIDKSFAGSEKPIKKKVLNVIYFSDASRTHSFKLSICTVRALFISLVVLLLWSGTSIFLLHKSYEGAEYLRSRLQDALSSLFNYKSRFESIFENAYPEVDPLKQATAVATEGASDTDAKNMVNNSSVTKLDLSAISDTEDFVSIPLVVEKNAKKDVAVSLEDPILHKKMGEQFIRVSFAVRNVVSPDKSNGYIWAVAKFMDGEGKLYFKPSPAGLELNAKGEAIEPMSRANKYSIRFYKEKSLNFALPLIKQINLLSIEVFMSGENTPQLSYRFVPAKNSSEHQYIRAGLKSVLNEEGE